MKILDHDLIQFYPNYYSNWNAAYESYKCKKCDAFIYYYKISKYFFRYKDYKEYNKYAVNGKYFLLNVNEDITCYECLIKKLLE